ncbi:MAG: 50S ribosomal protein L4 [Pirellulales bacterium]
MASLPIYNRAGNEVGRYEIDPADFAQRINKQLLHDAVVMYQANLRQGSAKTKARNEVAGSTRKLFRQKGTGRARAGSIRSGTRRGGGHIKHKQPRDWSYRLPRKSLQAATRMAIASKIRDDELVLIDDLSFAAPKTRDVAAMFKALNISGQSVHVATEKYDANTYKSVRNLARATVSPVFELTALSVLRPRRLLITTAALESLRRPAANSTEAES